MQTGVSVLTGVVTTRFGEIPSEPICTVISDWSADCWPPPPLPPPLDVLPPLVCPALEPVQSLATQTGALALIGALTVPAGLIPTEPTWPVISDWSAVCWPPPPLPPVVAVPPPLVCPALEPEQSLATQTGVLALIGALTVPAGL